MCSRGQLCHAVLASEDEVLLFAPEHAPGQKLAISHTFWHAALCFFSDASRAALHRTRSALHVPVTQRSAPCTHACRQPPHVVAHASAQASSLHDRLQVAHDAAHDLPQASQVAVHFGLQVSSCAS